MLEQKIDERWLMLWERLGRNSAQSHLEWRRLITAYSLPERTYHTIEHVLECQGELDNCRTLARDPDVLEAALWYHDAVYDPQKYDNEEASARLACEVFYRAGLPIERLKMVEQLILATRHSFVPSDKDSALIVDIDLSILGANTERFDRYEAAIRREYSFVPDVVFRNKRAEILEGFLSRSFLFTTPAFRERFELKARENLTRSLERLKRINGEGNA
jgi:predicted metal-dependent HD superfamily phosphohydrolase